MIAAVESYLVVRRAAGFTLSNTEYLLRSFAGFAVERKQAHVRTATAIAWASRAKSVAQRHTRYQTICRFTQYLRAEDPRHESPPANHFAYRLTRRVPHIYSRDDIAELILAATKLSSSDPLQPKTYASLISLLAATGMRISEALNLLVSDITPSGGLLIRRTKFQKTRLVPLHETAVAGLGHYLEPSSGDTSGWRSRFRFGGRATSYLLESSQPVPNPSEIGRAEAVSRSMATYS